MRATSSSYCKKFAIKAATCFGIGDLYLFPGTLGSLAAFISLPLFLFFDLSYQSIFFASCILIIFGIYCCSEYQINSKAVDPSNVVIDEFVAQLILLALIKVALPICTKLIYVKYCAMSFILFRFFDILKPWPINIIQHNCKSAFAVMLDDLVAALFSYGILYCFIKLVH